MGLEKFNYAIDADVEKNGAKEIVWNNDDKSFEKSQDTYNSLFTEEELLAIHKEIDDEDKASLDAARSESTGILVALRESELPDDYYYDAQMLGEATKDVLPQDKLEILQKVRADHGAALFVGDGINDAPVLAGADVGAAMGSGADAAIEAADVVFMKSNVSAIPKAIAIAKSAQRIAWQNVVFALIIKFIVMILGLVGFANMWMAVFADTGVAMICVLNSIRVLYKKHNN